MLLQSRRSAGYTELELQMSSDERHRRSKRFKTSCASCRERKARFRYRREVRADANHALCFECYRGEVNRARARRLSETATRLE
jgi:hypothetical protein